MTPELVTKTYINSAIRDKAYTTSMRAAIMAAMRQIGSEIEEGKGLYNFQMILISSKLIMRRARIKYEKQMIIYANSPTGSPPEELFMAIQSNYHGKWTGHTSQFVSAQTLWARNTNSWKDIDIDDPLIRATWSYALQEIDVLKDTTFRTPIANILSKSKPPKQKQSYSYQQYISDAAMNVSSKVLKSGFDPWPSKLTKKAFQNKLNTLGKITGAQFVVAENLFDAGLVAPDTELFWDVLYKMADYKTARDASIGSLGPMAMILTALSVEQLEVQESVPEGTRNAVETWVISRGILPGDPAYERTVNGYLACLPDYITPEVEQRFKIVKTILKVLLFNKFESAVQAALYLTPTMNLILSGPTLILEGTDSFTPSPDFVDLISNKGLGRAENVRHEIYADIKKIRMRVFYGFNTFDLGFNTSEADDSDWEMYKNDEAETWPAVEFSLSVKNNELYIDEAISREPSTAYDIVYDGAPGWGSVDEKHLLEKLMAWKTFPAHVAMKLYKVMDKLGCTRIAKIPKITFKPKHDLSMKSSDKSVEIINEILSKGNGEVDFGKETLMPNNSASGIVDEIPMSGVKEIDIYRGAIESENRPFRTWALNLNGLAFGMLKGYTMPMQKTSVIKENWVELSEIFERLFLSGGGEVANRGIKYLLFDGVPSEIGIVQDSQGGSMLVVSPRIKFDGQTSFLLSSYGPESDIAIEAMNIALKQFREYQEVDVELLKRTKTHSSGSIRRLFDRITFPQDYEEEKTR